MMRTLPDGVEKYAESPLFTERSAPDKLMSKHNLKAGVWGLLSVSAGRLEYHMPRSDDQFFVVEEGDQVVIEPTEVHFVTPIGPVEFKVEFYR